MSANRCAVSRRPAKIRAPSATPTLSSAAPTPKMPMSSALVPLAWQAL